MNNKQALLSHGGFWSAYENLTTFFLVAYALTLGADNVAIGIIGAIPYIATFLAEIPGAKLIEYFSRKNICTYATAVSRMFWLGIAVIPVLLPRNPLATVVIFYLLMRIVEYLSDPSWTSIIADIVPAKERGTYFGKRNTLMGITGTVASIAGGFYLSTFENQFYTLFGIGILFGIMATYSITRIREPAYQDHEKHSLKDFLIHDGQFRKFTIIIFFFHFSIMLASPFFTVYMLKNLELSYSTYALFTAIQTISMIACYHPMGKLLDKLGDKTLTMISAAATSIIPLMFIFITKETYWLIVPAQIISGIAWAANNLGLNNMLIGLSSPKIRALQIAGYQVITSIALIAGPIIGGIIADDANIILTGIPLVFAISFILRLISGLAIYHIKEPRRESSVGDVFHEAIGMGSEITHVIRVVVKKVNRWM